MNIVERFLKYVSFDTQSAEDAGKTPSTDKQLKLAEHLKEELAAIGLTEVEMDANGYVYATLPANTEKAVPTIGFIAHMDTSPDCSGEGVKPRIVKAYDGGDIVLDERDGLVTSPKKFPELLDHVGEDIIVTDGHTLLGADDKAGIAEIVTAMEYLLAHPEIEHGKVRVGFNPDEEIGLGAHKFDVAKFGCEWGYTMDGGEIGELEYENFNAASAKIEVKGVSVHPGYAKGKMVNAARVAAEFAAMMPATDTPEQTAEYEGFFHLTGIEGNVERATLNYIIRDHDRQKFENRKAFVEKAVEWANARFGEGTVTATIRDQYYNMREKIEPVPHVVEIVLQAMRECGIPSKVRAIRGGTDGAQLSFMGLPCPNIFAGGLNFHGPHEFLPVPSLEKASQLVAKIVELTAKR